MGINIADLTIQSPNFMHGGPLDTKFSADGLNVHPILRIAGAPEQAVELAIICHDPDAPLPHGFTHWVLYGVSTDVTEIAPETSSRFVTGPNGLGMRAYSGPQPPSGHGKHHYYFWVYALARSVEGSPTREQFLSAYANDIVEQNRIVGTFES